MKKTILFILFVNLIVLLSISFSNKYDIQDEGKIGDVKYSVLDENKFRQQNGNGWVLMNGDTLDKNKTELNQYIQLAGEIIPDGRGVFIRGMNGLRPLTEGDPQENRRVGEYQNDQLIRHTHAVTVYHSHASGAGDAVGGHISADGTDRFFSTYQTGEGTEFNNKFGEETRPRNIALYVYIKISE